MSKFTLILSVLFLMLFAPLQIQAAHATLSGKIQDATTGEPLMGTNISVKGTSIGTTSNNAGEFTISNIPPGKYTLIFTYMGYKTKTEPVIIHVNEAPFLNIRLEPKVLEGEKVVVTADAELNRAIERETPMAFTKLDIVELREKATTGDLPELLENVPGVWISSAGIGETEMTLRGFSSENVRFTVDDIPMNEPEDQRVYWSNWAGLSNSVNSIEVHRGPGYSAFGSGAIGGSVHIETMGVSHQRGASFRVSGGSYNRIGIASGPNAGFILNPLEDNGLQESNNAVNYTYSGRVNSGPLLGGKLNVSAYLEYKTGDSYLLGTTYDGYSLGLNAESNFGAHLLRLNFLISPQSHNQAFSLQDIDLIQKIGREYNRKNHEWQENYYSKPFLSLKDEWRISEKTTLSSTVFLTAGNGADQSSVNEVFDTETGATYIPELASTAPLGRHAWYLYENYGLEAEGFCEGGGYVNFMESDISSSTPANLFTEQTVLAWQKRERRDHTQFGFSTYLKSMLSSKLQITTGLEGRQWDGNRTGEVWNLRYIPDLNYFTRYDPSWSSAARAYYAGLFTPQTGELQPLYDYDTNVTNFSAFGRINYHPVERMTLQAGGQLYYSDQEVVEIPIQFWDPGSFDFFDYSLRSTADKIDTAGNKRFKNSDYQKTYVFFTPWLGGNYNLNERLNFFANYAVAKKEPALLDWYDYADGPLTGENELKEETAHSIEFGMGHRTHWLQTNVNYYYTLYQDKIESVIDIDERRQTLNAGKALFQGVELELNGKYSQIDFGASASFAQNRWQEMNVTSIFDTDAKDVEGKVVPFSPERIASVHFGYYFKPSPQERCRIGVKCDYWNEYYGTYTNYYTREDGTEAKAKLPYFLDLNAHLTYTKTFEKTDVTFRIDVNNLLNRVDNFYKAQYSIDYSRSDQFAGQYRWYVLQAPLLNVFVTAEVSIH